MATVGIIGAGISGLSSAYYLAKTLPRSQLGKIIVYESSSRVGGLVQTKRFTEDDGAIFEQGPRSVRSIGSGGHDIIRLVESLGLSDEVIAIGHKNPVASNRYIYVNKELCALPVGFGSLFKKQAPFSKSLAALGYKEFFRKSEKVDDESVDSFFRRRFGDEISKYAIDCLMRGIYSGKSTELSMKAILPKLLEIEQKHGSVLKGALFPQRSPKFSIDDSPLLKKFREQKWSMWTLRDGLERLPERLAEWLREEDRVEFRLDADIRALRFLTTENGVRPSIDLSHNGSCTTEELDHVIAALPAKSLASILESKTHTPNQISTKELTQLLRYNESATVGVVSFQFDRTDIIKKPAFGHLIPSCEPSNVLGILYESCVFPDHNGRSNGGQSTRLGCMMGGAWFKEQFRAGVTEEELVELALESVREQLGVKDTPVRHVVKIARDCIPQYGVGHVDRRQDMTSYIDEYSLPLTLTGASYDGVSVVDCVKHARRDVADIELNAAATGPGVKYNF